MAGVEPTEDQSLWDQNLPQRLFATGRYPKAKLNVYSRPDILSFVQTHLEDTPEWVKLRNSRFGGLYNIPTSWCPLSCQLLHSLISRQLVTRQKYQLWTVFGGQPLRFSLVEFAELTGLHCGEFHQYYNPELEAKPRQGKDSQWERYIGKDPKTNLAEVSKLLANSKEMDMPGWRRLGLALILIVDGVLIAERQVHKPTPRYVEMLKDEEAFLNFPWGRESFLRTLSSMRPLRNASEKCPDPVVGLCQQLQQQSFSLKGFPLVLQLLAFKCIPQLLQKVSRGTILNRLGEVPFIGLGKFTVMVKKDVLDVEYAEQLSVQPKLELSENFTPGWAVWYDEATDPAVTYLEKKIDDQHRFTPNEWPGGDASLEKYEPLQQPNYRTRQKHIIDRKNGTKPTQAFKKKNSNRKQRRLSAYFSKQPQTIDEVIAWMEKKQAAQAAKYQDEIDGLRNTLSEVISKAAKQEEKLKKIYQNRKICFGGFGKLSKPRRCMFVRKTPNKTIPLPSPTCSTPIAPHDNYTTNSPKQYGTTTNFELGGTRAYADIPNSGMDHLEADISDEGITKLVNNIVKDSISPDRYSPTTLNHSPEPAPLQMPAAPDTILDPIKPFLPSVDPIPIMLADPSGEIHNAFKENFPGRHRHAFRYTYQRNLRPRPIKRVSPIKQAKVPRKRELVCLSDGSPAKPLSKQAASAEEKALSQLLLSKCQRNPNNLFPELDIQTFDRLHLYLASEPKKIHKCSIDDLNNKFFITLSKPEDWVSTTHMEALMEIFQFQHQDHLSRDRARFVSPWFLSQLQTKQSAFQNSRDKEGFRWGTAIQNFVHEEGYQWFADIDTIYIPMNWESCHWVGLVIDLRLSSITVLDAIIRITDDDTFDSLMDPLRNMLPYVVNSYCKEYLAEDHVCSPFTVNRPTSLYQNERCGDCGPLAAKFLEMYCRGLVPEQMGAITDHDVDTMRKQYAIDAFAHFVAPLSSSSK